jgi:IS30 family transposase
VKRAAWHRSTWRHTLGVICHFGREEIALLWAQDCSVREISRRLERSPSTISRELRRNAATRGGTLVYRATVAQWKAERAAERPKASKLAENDQLRTYVQDRLAGTVTDFGASRFPDLTFRGKDEDKDVVRTVAGALAGVRSKSVGEFRLTIPMIDLWISHEAIYQALYIQGRGFATRAYCLPAFGPRTSRAAGQDATARKALRHSEVMISERPAEIADRAVPGHWEGDLIIGC